MSLGRRGFLAGGSILAGGGLLPVAEAAAAMPGDGRGIAEYGVDADGVGDQTAALQRAIDEISKSGHPVLIPAGRYLTGPLRIPARCAIAGGPGAMFVSARPGEPVFDASANEALHISGLVFDGAAQGKPRGQSRALIAIRGGTAHISGCRMLRCGGGAIAVEAGAGSLRGVEVEGSYGAAIQIAKARGFSVTACDIASAEGEGIRAASGGETDGVLLIGNRIGGCATGIALAGSGVANGNFISGATVTGLRLGSGGIEGQIVATGNNIRDCAVGIGVAAGGETIFASLNLITGARDGAIRAFDGQILVGPDLARESAEAYLNLTVAGNVAR
jgi:uncharacterized secreted repeat protein (TIGR03808 family)